MSSVGVFMGAADSCRDAARLASEACERSLTIRERVDLQAHLLVCIACRTYRRQLRSLQLLARSSPTPDLTRAPDAGLSSEARGRILEALRRKATASNTEEKKTL
jgi:hypothetical protein